MSNPGFHYLMLGIALFGSIMGYMGNNAWAMGFNVACAAWWTYLITRSPRRKAPEATDE